MCAPILDLSSPSTYNFLILVNVSPSISTSRWPIHSPNCIAWQHTRASTTNANGMCSFISNHQTYAGLLEMVLKGDIKFDLHYRALRRPPSLQLQPPRQYVLGKCLHLLNCHIPYEANQSRKTCFVVSDPSPHLGHLVEPITLRTVN
ncbi:hypothetical protein E1A91_D04G053000v1 [Gossypium mustelinum]|uniref:Uncharacterized protein n=3 Tax=Gossypium TaxID=3633 RepID=A0A5J5RVZ6_GOSBA|nr:hypothetical protein ES319_D04G051700v1 [Gossypium barbadense]TYG72882.1 hypothetical protein ES288_D04G055500v1 [Gossypium darwinii]TYI86262.1 hypothetical protein E1A91_D04G053000v1 [Gossypium mustelinum]